VRRTRPFIVPICVDDTPETDAGVPDSYSAAQWTRLHDGDTRRAFVECDLRLRSPEAAYAPGEARSPAAPYTHWGCVPTACADSCRAATNGPSR
jgi:hypothetical protein